MINISLLLTTVIFSALRNIFSKKISSHPFGSSAFFLLQTFIFIAGGAIVLIFSLPKNISMYTVFISLCYAAFLLLAQWCYTATLSKMKVAVCSTVYSLGFIIPTVVGFVCWGEPFTVYKFFGILLAICTVIASGINTNRQANEKADKRYFPLLIVAMISSGMLGVIQKIHQSIPSITDERSMFVVVAFFAAAIISFASSVLSKTKTENANKSNILFALGTGAAFGICNLLNTTLAGRMKSSIFFPVQNISVIILSTVLGIVFFKEKFKLKELIVLFLGFGSIFFLSVL